MYAYCQNDPVNAVDPSGYAIETIWDLISWTLSAYQLLYYPSWANLGFLALDSLSLAIPFLPALGSADDGVKYLIKGVSKIDDVVDVAKVAKNVSLAEETFKTMSSSTFRNNLLRWTGKTAQEMGEMQAHHLFPQMFRSQFAKIGINVDNPVFGAWWNSTKHLKNSNFYNNIWKQFFKLSNPTKEEAYLVAKILSGLFGYKTYI